MKNLNKLTALTLTAALTAALTACGGGLPPEIPRRRGIPSRSWCCPPSV